MLFGFTATGGGFTAAGDGFTAAGGGFAFRTVACYCALAVVDSLAETALQKRTTLLNLTKPY
eukprot:9115909-Pyramimonas_sp.AAC.1